MNNPFSSGMDCSPSDIKSSDILSAPSSSGASNQQYCLKWNNYAASVTSTFKTILAGEDFVDVSLIAAKGHTLKAHRVVLAACSVYFREILKGISLWHHPVIILKDVPYSDLQGIIEFIYHGEVSVNQESLSSFLKSAEILKVKGLTEEDPPPSEDEVKEHSNLFSNNNDLLSSSLVQPQSSKHNRKSSNPVQIKQSSSSLRSVINETPDEYRVQSPPKKKMQPSLETFSRFSMMSAESHDLKIEEEPCEIDEDEDMDSSQMRLGMVKACTPTLSTQKKTCPYCYQQLSWHALSRHIRDMHKKQSSFVTCKYCEKVFRNKNSLGCHMWRFHKDMKDKEPPASSPLPTSDEFGSKKDEN